jgi:hypothetical protein
MAADGKEVELNNGLAAGLFYSMKTINTVNSRVSLHSTATGGSVTPL